MRPRANDNTSADTLVLATGDAFKSSRLDKMLRNLTASYKLYWLKGVFDEAIAGNTHISFEKLAARMVASAWYPVTYFRLNFGATDMLTSAVLCAQERCELTADASEQDIIAAIMESEDATLRAKMMDLYRYVPYRLVRPFYADRFEAVRKTEGRITDAMVNGLVAQFSREDAAGAPYRFSADSDGIEIDADWARYFTDNRHVVQGWFNSQLVNYLQARNPSIPAIPLKIYPPMARDLSAAHKYWEEALADHDFTDIYSGITFNSTGFTAHGPMGVDHFIPWSFVLHDEPWNLAPTFRDTNSSKGNKLPDLGEFLRPFCEQQFDALITLRGTGRHKNVFEAYAQVDPHVMDYERTDAALESFVESVSKVVIPLHQIAANQGFPTWQPSTEYAVTDFV